MFDISFGGASDFVGVVFGQFEACRESQPASIDVFSPFQKGPCRVGQEKDLHHFDLMGHVLYFEWGLIHSRVLADLTDVTRCFQSFRIR